MHDNDGKESGTFKQCPACGSSTWRSTNPPDYSWDEATREKAYHDFERFLEKRDTEDRKLMEKVEPFAFAQYLMDSAEEQVQAERTESA